METLPIIVLLVLIILALPIALAIWLIVRAADARDRISELSRRVGTLEVESLRLRQERERNAATADEIKTPAAAVAPMPAAQSQTAPETVKTAPPPIIPPEPVIPPE